MKSKQKTTQPKEFGNRLAAFRQYRNVSAPAMSLDLGLNRNYINGIEAHRFLPSLSTFFEICDYLQITPGRFFSTKIVKGEPVPAEASPLMILCEELTQEQSDSLYQMLCQFIK